jgi:hypothetical protein
MATDEQNKSVSRLGKISVLTLAIMNVAAVVSLRGPSSFR